MHLSTLLPHLLLPTQDRALEEKSNIVLSGVGMYVCMSSNTNTLVVCKVYVLSERVRIEDLQGGE